MYRLIDDLADASALLDAGRTDEAVARFADVERRVRDELPAEIAALRELSAAYSACLERLVARRDALADCHAGERRGAHAARRYLEGACI